MVYFLTVGKAIVIRELVNKDRSILPSLPIRLGMIKQFIKALDKEGDCFNINNFKTYLN